jgi:CHAT domain-containing protein/Flp pilus assembly protein TadD
MKNKIPFLMLVAALTTHNAIAENVNAELQQLQQALAANPNNAKLINDTGLALYEAGNYAEAEVLLIKSLALREQELGQDHPNVATSLNNLALLYNKQGNYAKAEPLYLKSLAIYEKTLGKQHFVVATSLNNLAALYYAQGKYSQAEPLYLRSLAIDEKTLGKNHPDVATDLNNLAELYRTQGKYKVAEPLLLRSIAISEAALGKDHPELAVSLNNLALLYKNQGQYAKAEPLNKRSLAIVEKTLAPDHPNVAINLSSVAGLYLEQGKYEQAEPLYRRSLAIREKIFGSDNLEVAESLNELALLYYAQNKYAAAEPLLQKSLAIREKVLGAQHPKVAESLNNLAMLDNAQSKYAEAEPLLLRSLAINEAAFGKQHASVGSDLNNLAALYYTQGKYKEAEPFYLKSLAILEHEFGTEHPQVGHGLNNLAALYMAQGKYKQAEPLYQRSLAISEKTLGKQHVDRASGLNNLALLYQAQGNYKAAESLLQRSLRLTNQALERWLWGAGEKTRQAYLQKQEFMKNIYLGFYSAQNSAEEAFYFSLARKGLLLRISSEVAALAKQSANPAIQAQIQQFNTLKAQLAAQVFSDKADKAQLQAIEEKSNLLEMQLSQAVSAFKRGKTEVTPKQVLAKLHDKQAVIDFLVYKDVDFQTMNYKSEQIMAVLADNQNGIKLIKLGELAPIMEAIKTYRQTILPTAQGQLAKRTEVLQPASQKLYQLIWQPLLPYLANKTEVFLIPDGILHLLPFKALQDKQGHYLAENLQLTLLTSARDIVLPSVTEKTSDSVVFAAPAFGENNDKTSNQPTRSIATRQQDIYFAPLDGAAAEGKAISDLIKTKQPLQFFQGAQANESSVAAIKSPRFLHFATHGFFLENIKPVETQNFASLPLVSPLSDGNIENPLTRSGLALTGANFGINGKKQADGTDGILTALEVLGLHLEGTNLVTLSACETGVGDIQVGEGVYSLNRAFQEAGAKAVLSTLWSVADEQTKLFMQNFYGLVLSGLSPQQALQKTQLKFINDKTTQDPFFWAAFTVVGI